MARPENEFPTIRDLRDRLDELIKEGLGELPIQIVVAPDSTIQALAKGLNNDGRPATMVEYGRDGRDIGVSFISTDRLTGHGSSSISH